MAQFKRHDKCQDCQLYGNADNPGIATRHLAGAGSDRALLVVGSAPGWEEDKGGLSWIGWTGKLLQKFIKAVAFELYADVYVTNAVRCCPSFHAKGPTNSEISACRPHLLVDIQLLLDEYKEVIILCCGAPAAKAVADVSSLREGLSLQGLTVGAKPLQILSRLPVLFFTYNPAILGLGKKPQMVHVVESHFILLARYLRGEFSPNKVQVVPEINPPPPDQKDFPKLVSIDIETYGILSGREQTVFTPYKSLKIDGAPYGKQVVTVALAYRDYTFAASPGRIRTCQYIWQDPSHIKHIREWIKRCIENKSVLLGQNFKFDMLYMMANDSEIRRLMKPDSIRVDDSMIWAFLLDEQQPEKGLKELCLLFGIDNYRGMKVSGKEGNARNSKDPHLHLYNSKDAANTLVLYEELRKRIEIRYGEKSAKLGEVCSQMRSDILWNVVGMEQAGVHVNLKKLKDVNDAYNSKATNALDTAGAMGVILGGTGSRTSLLEFMDSALKEAGLTDDGRVERTEARQEISVTRGNRQLLLEYLNPGRNRELAELLETYKENQHLRDTYTNKLLTNRRDGIVSRDSIRGLMVPEWYPVPSVFQKGSEQGKEKTGGTIQGRITARKPPYQTFPQSVKQCKCSRFPGGTLRNYDLSQIELRVPTIFSGDEAFMKTWAEDGDPHMDSAIIMFPEMLGVKKETMTSEQNDKRQLAKKSNFLIIYRGGAYTLRDSARAELGLMLDLTFCEEMIQNWYLGHMGIRAWQDDLIREVARTGYLEVVTGWSRTFGQGRDNAAACVNDICNFPVQTIAAQLMLSAQAKINWELSRRNLRAKLCGQAYDAVTIDTPYKETEEVDAIVDQWLPNPPLLKIVTDFYGRSVPLKYERKIA